MRQQDNMESLGDRNKTFVIVFHMQSKDVIKLLKSQPTMPCYASPIYKICTDPHMNQSTHHLHSSS